MNSLRSPEQNLLLSEHRAILPSASRWSPQAGVAWPALMCGSDEGVASNITCTWPPKRSLSAGDEPRYGTWTISTAAIILNNSPVTWLVDPLPADAMLILPGLALA